MWVNIYNYFFKVFYNINLLFLFDESKDNDFVKKYFFKVF